VTSHGRQPLTPAHRVARNPGALSAEIDGEVVALDVARGACYGLDAIGARIWSMIASPTAVGEVCAALTAIYDVDVETCRTDVLDLFRALRDEGLIVVAPAPTSPRSR
jgi:Coenzyme PQQ synthesis protein D (PqqD)